MTDEIKGGSVLSLTTKIVSAYVSKNALPPATLSEFIGNVHRSMSNLAIGKTEAPLAPLVPAVPIKKSITADYIISLEDGRKFKSMKRYLGKLGMTPAEYRQKWDLPANYPMVAPNYAAARSALAKSMGLGRKTAAATTPQTKRRTKRAA
jgi:predicted transcriptional regulator